MVRNNQFTERNKVVTAEAVSEEMKLNVVRLAKPSRPGESVKSCVRRVSTATGLKFGQVRRLWYRTWKTVPAHVADQVRNAVNQHERRLDAELITLKARLDALNHECSDPGIHPENAAESGGGPA